jgi:hypothetical protein
MPHILILKLSNGVLSSTPKAFQIRFIFFLIFLGEEFDNITG